MELLTRIWLIFGYFVYWIAWIGSVAMGLASIKKGILIGLIAYAVWFIIFLLILYREYNKN